MSEKGYTPLQGAAGMETCAGIWRTPGFEGVHHK